MEKEYFDTALYEEWKACPYAQSDFVLSYPEWLIMRANPHISEGPLRWGSLWAGWYEDIKGIEYNIPGFMPITPRPAP